MLNLPISLIGMPGSGKSTIGKKLAEELNLSFIDSDQAIETRIGLPCAELFDREGEAFFRNLEYQEISKALSNRCVLATGGGAFVQEKTRKILQRDSISVFIDVPLSLLKARLLDDETRPLLREPGALEKLFEERLEYYKLADNRVVVENSDTTWLIVNKIMAVL